MKRLMFFVCIAIAMLAFDFSAQATSLDGTSNIVYKTVPQVFHNGEFAKGFVALKNGFTVPAMAGARLNLVVPISYGMDLRTTGSIILENNLQLDSGFTLSSSGTICGNGYSLILNDNLIIPAQSTLKITSTLIIDGNNHTIFFDGYSQILVDRHSTLTLKNIILKNSFNNSGKPVIGTGGTDSKVAFDNVKFALTDDFFFNQGSFFVHNNVDYNGNTSFYYQSPQTSFIAPQGTFYFDNQSRFFYNPQDTSDNLIVMQDPSSTLFFDGSTLRSTPTGLILNEGNLYFDDKVNLDAGVSLTVSDYELALIEYAPTSGGAVTTISWHPSGKYVALSGYNAESGQGGFDNTDCLRIYGFDINTPPYFFPATSIPSGIDVAWRGDGEYIALLGRDLPPTLSVYKFNQSPIELVPLASATVYELPGQFYELIDWHPSGQYISLVNINTDNNPQINVYYFNNIRKSMDLFTTTSINFSAIISCAKWNPSGEYLATANDDLSTGWISIYYFDQFNPDQNSRLQKFATVYFDSPIKNVDWSSDSLYIAICGYDINNQTKIYEFNPSGNPQLTFISEKQIFGDYGATGLKWTPNRSFLSSGGADGAFVTYEFDPTKPSTYMKMDQISRTDTYRSYYGTLSLNWNPDGTILSAALPESAVFYKFVAPNQELVATENFQLEKILHGIKSVSWHPNKQYIAASGYGAGPDGTLNNNDGIRIYRFEDIANSLKPITSKSYGNYTVNSIAVLNDNIATGNSSSDLTANFVGKAQWNQPFTLPPSDGTIVNHYGSPEFGGQINSVAWVATSYIAAAGSNAGNTIKVYQDTGSALNFSAQSPTYGGTINSIASVDSNYIAAGGSNAGKTVRLYQFIPSGTFSQIAETSTGYGGTINSLDAVINFNGNKKIAIGGSNPGNTIQIYSYDGVTFDKTDESGDCGGQINDVKFLGYPYLFATGDWGSIKVFQTLNAWDITLIAESDTYPNPLKSLFATYFAGTYIMIFSIETNTNIVRAHILDGPNLTLFYQSEPFPNELSAIAGQVTTKYGGAGIVLGDNNNLIKIYNLYTSEFGINFSMIGGTPAAPNTVNSSIWSPDGNFLAVGGKYPSNAGGFANNDELRIYHFYKNELYPVTSQSIGSEINALCWHPSEKYLAVATGSNVYIYSFDGSSLSFVTNYALNCDSLDWSPDGQFLAATEVGTSTFYVLQFINESSLFLLCSATGSSTVNWNSDGKYIATKSYNQALSIYSFTGSSLTLVNQTQSVFENTNKIKFAKDAHSIASVADVYVDMFQTLPGGSQLFYFNGSQSMTSSSKDSIISAEGLDWRVDGNYIGVGNVDTPFEAPDLLIYKISYLANYLNQSKGLNLEKNLNINVLGGANINVNGIVNFNKE